MQILRFLYQVSSSVWSSSVSGQLLPRLSIILLIHAFVHFVWFRCGLIDWSENDIYLGYSSHHLRIISLIVFTINVICNISGYVFLTYLYSHSVRTIFNREIPSTWDGRIQSFAAHLALLRPLQVIFRYLTSSFRVLPDVIVVGEVRCGTTSFCEYLSSIDGCHPPFCLWMHPELDKKETFYFVGHYLGYVTPAQYRMCFPLKITKWFHERILRKPFFTFDGCAQYLTSPTAPYLIAEAYRAANQPPPVLVACVRDPVDQAVSWWRYENNAMLWGESLGLSKWNTDLRTEQYPPKSIIGALHFSQSRFVSDSYYNSEKLFATLTSMRVQHHNPIPRRIVLPNWAMSWPAGQLGSIGRNGMFSDNMERYNRVFRSIFPQTLRQNSIMIQGDPGEEKKHQECNGQDFITVVPLRALSEPKQLNKLLISIFKKVVNRQSNHFNNSAKVIKLMESKVAIKKIRRNSTNKLQKSEMEPTTDDLKELGKFFENEVRRFHAQYGIKL